jgi:hypothetical protein
MLYQLLTGKVPFLTQMEVTNCNVPSFPLIFDEFAKDLITRLL